MASFAAQTEQHIAFAVIEGNVKEQYERGVFGRLLLGAISAAPDPAGNPDWPKALAGVLTDRLEHWARHEQKVDSLLFAGALFAEDAVSVCTAGDIRVHLLLGGKLSKVTRDHTIIDDPVEGVTNALTPLQREVHVSVPTRWLGPTADRAPESKTWSLSGDYDVLVNSSLIHRYREPEHYLKALQSDKKCRRILSRYPGIIARFNILK